MRSILWIIILCLAALGCKNEPYETTPLGVTGLINHGANVNNTYVYRDQKLYSFLSVGTDTIAYMKFRYANEELVNIVSDSTRFSYKLTSFYPGGDAVVDSTFVYDTAGVRLYSTRSITYDGDRNPLTVNLKIWPDSVASNQLAELTWEEGNVVKLVTSDLSSGEKVLLRDLTVGHDDQYCVYMKNNNYLFTLSLDELYWLSKNNPELFNAGAGEKEYTYWYNKLGYPSNFKSETGVLYGVAYKQIR